MSSKILGFVFGLILVVKSIIGFPLFRERNAASGNNREQQQNIKNHLKTKEKHLKTSIYSTFFQPNRGRKLTSLSYMQIVRSLANTNIYIYIYILYYLRNNRGKKQTNE